MANLCEPDLDEFKSLTALKGEVAEIVQPETSHLLLNNVDTVVALPLETQEDVRYRLFYLVDTPIDAGSTKQDVHEAPISSVVRDTQGQKTRIAFLPNFDGRFASLLFVGCDPTAQAASDGVPTQFAMLNARLSHKWNGIVWVAVAGVIVFGVVALMVRANRAKLGSHKKAFYFIFSNFRREVSLSLFQLFIFTIAVVLTVAYYFGRTGQLSDLSEDVLLLLGISAAGAVAGAWGDGMKNRLSWGNWRWLDRHGAFQEVDEHLDLRLSQLVTTRGEFNLYRFQALLFTMLVAPTFVIAAAYTLGSAEIPPGILAVLGLSQVTYLVGKFADTPTVTDFDAALTEQSQKFEAGERLTQAGFRELKEQFLAAMGMGWSNENKAQAAGDLLAATDVTPVEIAKQAALSSAAAAKAQVATKVDPAAALVQAEVASAAATEAETALKTFTRALYASEAAEAARASAAAAQKAASALAAINALP
jgi:hypothetical protein